MPDPIPSTPIPASALLLATPIRTSALLPATPTPAMGYKGVGLADAGQVATSIHQSIENVFKTIPDGVSGIALDVHTQRGVNVVIGQRLGKSWQVVGDFGTSGWTDPQAGVAVRGTW